MVNLGIALALVCAVVTQLAFLCKHRGANAAPVVELRRPLASAKALLGSKWFAAGMTIAAGGWLLHVVALALAPLSMVQAVQSPGVVVVAVPGTGCSAARCLAAPRLGAPSHHHGAVLGAAPGVLFGVPDVAVRALTNAASDGVFAVVGSPWLTIAAAGSVLAFLASARGFQSARPCRDRLHVDRRPRHLHPRRHPRVRRRAVGRDGAAPRPDRRLGAGGRGGPADPGGARVDRHRFNCGIEGAALAAVHLVDRVAFAVPRLNLRTVLAFNETLWLWGDAVM